MNLEEQRHSNFFCRVTFKDKFSTSCQIVNHYSRTLDRHNTFHGMGINGYSTPATSVEVKIQRLNAQPKALSLNRSLTSQPTAKVINRIFIQKASNITTEVSQ